MSNGGVPFPELIFGSIPDYLFNSIVHQQEPGTLDETKFLDARPPMRPTEIFAFEITNPTHMT